jgi:hypothetical protein
MSFHGIIWLAKSALSMFYYSAFVLRIKIESTYQNIFQCEKDKKAAKVLWTPTAPATKRLRHKRFPPLKGTPPIIPFPFGFPHCPYLFIAFFFSLFSFGKMLFEAGGLREKKRDCTTFKKNDYEHYWTSDKRCTNTHIVK